MRVYNLFLVIILVRLDVFCEESPIDIAKQIANHECLLKNMTFIWRDAQSLLKKAIISKADVDLKGIFEMIKGDLSTSTSFLKRCIQATPLKASVMNKEEYRRIGERLQVLRAGAARSYLDDWNSFLNNNLDDIKNSNTYKYFIRILKSVIHDQGLRESIARNLLAILKFAHSFIPSPSKLSSETFPRLEDCTTFYSGLEGVRKMNEYKSLRDGLLEYYSKNSLSLIQKARALMDYARNIKTRTDWCTE